jgi:hypothetical protein
VQVEQETPADGALERATLVLAQDAAPDAEVAVVDTDMVGAQGLVVDLQSYWLPVCHSGSDSISAPTGALNHLDYKKRPA